MSQTHRQADGQTDRRTSDQTNEGASKHTNKQAIKPINISNNDQLLMVNPRVLNFVFLRRRAEKLRVGRSKSRVVVQRRIELVKPPEASITTRTPQKAPGSQNPAQEEVHPRSPNEPPGGKNTACMLQEAPGKKKPAPEAP